MGLTSTLPRDVTPASRVSIEVQEAQDRSLHRAKLPFLGLLVFTAILFGRPADLYRPLAEIPLAQIAALAAIAAYGAALLMGRAPLVITTEVKLVAGMTLCFLFSIPFAFWKGLAFDTFKEDWLKTLIIFYVLTQTVFTLKRLKMLLWVIIICMCFLSIFGLTTSRGAMVGDDQRFGGGTRGFFSGTYLGLAVGVVLPYIAALLVRSRSALRSLFLVSSFGLVMLMVVRTASRGSMLSIIMSLALVWALVLRQSMKARLMGVVFAMAILVAILIAPGVFWDRIRTLWDPQSYATSSVSASAEQSTNQRTGLLKRSISYTLQNPLFGVGLGNFQVVSGTMTQNAHEWKGTHNTYTQISSEAGIPALIMFVALLFFTARNMNRISQDCANNPEFNELVLLARATQASIMSFMFSGFFAHLAYDYYLYYLIGFSVALQSVYNRVKNYEAAVTPATNGKPSYGRNEGVGRLRNGNGARGRAW